MELINDYLHIEKGETRLEYNGILKGIRNEAKELKSVELFYNRKNNDEFAEELINYFKHKYKIY